mmetsp:Transcript_15459/g.32383  ORF Transcript_15459/g.32383 Transcript_15459/m.32383 type:complete len:81 (-) Transcript_15459:282-524(-)
MQCRSEGKTEAMDGFGGGVGCASDGEEWRFGLDFRKVWWGRGWRGENAASSSAGHHARNLCLSSQMVKKSLRRAKRICTF